LDYRLDWNRSLIAFLAVASLIVGPWLSLSATSGNSIDYKIFSVVASTETGDLKASYPEMLLRYEEGEKSIDVTLAAKLAQYMKLFQIWAVVTITLFIFSAFIENHKKLYLATGASLLLMAFAFLLVAYHITSSLNIVNSIQDLLFGKVVKIQVAFVRAYLTLQIGWSWIMALIAGALMTLYAWKYRYWRLVGI